MPETAPNSNPIFGGPYLDGHVPDPLVLNDMASAIHQANPTSGTVASGDAPASTNLDSSSAASDVTQYAADLAGGNNVR